MSTVQRFDFGVIKGKPTRTPQGFLKIPGNLTRVGVLIYRNADGEVASRELRLPAEVFDAGSLATLEGAPVTDLHPAGLVTPENVRVLQRGIVAADVKKDGRFVAASVVVQDAHLIEAVESGARRELSAGYTCFLEKKDGTWEGEQYDSIQRAIVYNHVAIGPRGWARAGSEVALKMDGVQDGSSALGEFVRDKLMRLPMTEEDAATKIGLDAWAFESFLSGYRSDALPDLSSLAALLRVPSKTLYDLVPLADRTDGQSKGRKMEPKIIRVDGIDYKVDEAAAPHIEKAIKDRDGKIATAEAGRDAEKARADAADAKTKELQVKLDAAENPERIAAMVSERVAVETKARAILGAEEKLDGLSLKDIKLKTITKVDSKLDLTGKSDAYVDARFDLIDSTKAAGNAASGDLAAIEAGRRDGSGAKPVTPDEAKKKMDAASAEAWKTPLTYSKDTAPAKA